MAYFPIFIQLGSCLVVGGGKVASRKVEALLEYGANVRVVAPEICGELEELAAEKAARLQLKKRVFAPDDVSGMSLVIAATSDNDCNRSVAAACRALHIPVNVVDVPELCDFYFPALVRRGDLVLGVSTGGKSPAFARSLRRWLEAHLPASLEEKLERAGKLREVILAAGKNPASDPAYNEAVTIE